MMYSTVRNQFGKILRANKKDEGECGYGDIFEFELISRHCFQTNKIKVYFIKFFQQNNYFYFLIFFT
jgi:hypothetical protein